MRRRRALPVVILSGVAALACGGGRSFDSASGCCVSRCNGCGTSYYECPDTGEHGDATCSRDRDSSGEETVTETGILDVDGDGYRPRDGDCDDSDPDIHPGETEVCDGVDQDCDGAVDDDAGAWQYPDTDGDGFGNRDVPVERVCEGTSGYVANRTDCDDTNAEVSPAASETCDGLDNDCDDQVDEGC